MEVVSRQMTSRMSGVVVRQFVPTRIEREILAQIFALVCDQCNPICGPCEGDVSDVSIRQIDQRTEDFAAGRRAS
jgi:hypothetical protein